MKNRIAIFLFILLMTAVTAFGQASWLDRPLTNWNNANGVVPNAPQPVAAIPANCRDQIRTPESVADRALTRAGWSLFGASQTFGVVTVINGTAGTDRACRPSQYNTFVFVNNRFAGTLSPTIMDSRSDGALVNARLNNLESISADFSRYRSSDDRCCPSQTSYVNYTITSGARTGVRAENVDTAVGGRKNDDGGVSTQDNVVSGTITYRQRTALPATAVVTVKLVDVSRADAPSATILEQRVETAGKQVPFSFDFAYDRSKVLERNSYVVQAEIRDGGRLLFITDTSYPVITQGNPKSVEIVVVPVGGGGGGGFQGSRTIRGTVSYLQRIALGPNSEVSVRLVDSAAPDGTPVAETRFSTAGKQVPYSFELRYEQRDINRQRNYELWAEIKTGGSVKFKSAAGQAVNLRGAQNDPVELVLTASTEETAVVTGRTLSLSKFGTGSIKIGDRQAQFLVRGSVNVSRDGTATVTVASLSSATVFTGKLTFFNGTTLRIMVDNAGDALASGEIEIRYTDRRLNSISASGLTIDGQDVTLRF
jgi:uncharacterized lipoprotein YbaY